MKKIYLILAAIATSTVSTPHSLPARSNPMTALGVLGVGGFGYKFLSAWREMQELEQQLEEFPSPRNKAAYEEAREEFMEVKAQLGKTRLRLILHALGTLASATLLAKEFYDTNNSTSVRGKFGSSSIGKEAHEPASTQLTLQEEIQREKENNRTRGFNDSEATIRILERALNTDASINPGRVDQLMTHVDPFAHERAYGTDQRNARRELMAQIRAPFQAEQQKKEATKAEEEATDLLRTIREKIQREKENNRTRGFNDSEATIRILERALNTDASINPGRVDQLMTHVDPFAHERAYGTDQRNARRELMAQIRAPFQAEQQKKEATKAEEEATDLLRNMRYADQINSADVAKYRALGGNEEELQEILHKKFMEATNWERFDRTEAEAILALNRSPLTTKEQEELNNKLDAALELSRYVMAKGLQSLGARVSEARQQSHVVNLVKQNLRQSVDFLQDLVNKLGINVNARDQNGRTALMDLVKNSSAHGADKVIQLNGIDIDTQDNDGNTALALAMQNAITNMNEETKEIIVTLLVRNAHVDTKTHDLVSQVIIAGYGKFQSWGKDLTRAFAHRGISIDLYNINPKELLKIKEKKGESVVYDLLKSGVRLPSDINPIAADLFVYALSQKQDFDLATTLLDYIDDVNKTDGEGNLLLVTAVKSGNSNLARATSLVQAIMEKNADVNMQGNYDTALTAALSISLSDYERTYDTSMLSLLLDTYSADPNITPKKVIKTPLSIAAHDGNVEAVTMLLKYGADVNQHSWSVQDTPLHRTVKPKTHDDYDFISGSYSQILAIAQKLLAAGAKKDALNKKGDTPYRLAMKNKALLDEAAQKEGQTDASELFALLKTAGAEA